MNETEYEIKADLENVTDLEPADAIDVFAPVFKVLCTSVSWASMLLEPCH